MTPTTNGATRLTVSRLTVRHLLGVEESSIDLIDGVNVFTGRNESGKSTHLKALEIGLGMKRATLSTLAPIDGEHASVVEMVLVGGGMEVEVRREGNGSPEVRYRKGGVWHEPNRPVEWLNSLINVHAALPALWLAADDETKATMILEACKIEGYDRDAMLIAIGLGAFVLPKIPTGLHPLEDIEAVEEAIRASRKVEGIQKRDEEAAAGKLLEGLPAEPPVDESAAIANITANVDVLTREIASESTEARTTRESSREQIKATCESRVGFTRGAHERRAAEMRAAVERQIADLATEMDAAIAAEREVADMSMTLIDDAFRHETARIDARKADLAQQRETLAAYTAHQDTLRTDRHVRSTAEAALAKSDKHAERYAELTKALAALSEYRLMLMEQLPIKGLTVRFDEKGRKHLLHDGKPSQHWSDGEMAKLAMQFALMGGTPPEDGAPYLPIILLDRAGDLSPAIRAALLLEVASRGNQVIAAVTTESDFTVLRGEEATRVEAVS